MMKVLGMGAVMLAAPAMAGEAQLPLVQLSSVTTYYGGSGADVGRTEVWLLLKVIPQGEGTLMGLKAAGEMTLADSHGVSEKARVDLWDAPDEPVVSGGTGGDGGVARGASYKVAIHAPVDQMRGNAVTVSGTLEMSYAGEIKKHDPVRVNLSGVNTIEVDEGIMMQVLSLSEAPGMSVLSVKIYGEGAERVHSLSFRDAKEGRKIKATVLSLQWERPADGEDGESVKKIRYALPEALSEVDVEVSSCVGIKTRRLPLHFRVALCGQVAPPKGKKE